VSRFLCGVLLLFAVSAAAQQREVYQSDDFVDPRHHTMPVFVSRLTLAATRGLIDDYQVLGGNATFIRITNTLYRDNWEFGLHHTEEIADAPRIFGCDCQPPIYFPTPPPSGTPPVGPKNTVQFGRYYALKLSKNEPPNMIRTRLTYSRQHVGDEIRSVTTGEVTGHRNGHEQSVGIDTDLRLPIGGHMLWGTVAYAQTWSSGTAHDHRQQEILYIARPPGWSAGPVLMRTTLTVGGVSNRGGTALNVINPAFEAFWHSQATKANLRLVWSPQLMRDRASGWQGHGQLALSVDRALWVHMFR
jgi:hypothetical protein